MLSRHGALPIWARALEAARPRGGRPRAASARPRRSSPSTPSAKNRSRRRLAALRAALAHGGGVPLLGLLLAGRLAEAAGDGGTPHQADELVEAPLQLAPLLGGHLRLGDLAEIDRKSTRLNSSH